MKHTRFVGFVGLKHGALILDITFKATDMGIATD
jgi:hypothetical protein